MMGCLVFRKPEMIFALFALAFGASAESAVSGEAAAPSPGWIMNGMNMLPLGDHPFGSQAACEEVRNLKSKLHVDTILIRKYLNMKDFDSDEIIDPPKDGASDAEILRQFKVDRKLGVKSFFDVGIKLQTDKDSDKDSCDPLWHPWHGVIDYPKPENYDKFFLNYGQKVLHYADLARKGGNVSVFSIGHETISLSATKKLQTPAEIQNYVMNLAWFLSPEHMAKGANSWARTTVSDLISFNDSLKKREAGAVPVAEISADHRSSFQRGMDSLRGFITAKKEELKESFSGPKAPPPDYRKEVVAWSEGGAKHELSAGATQYLIQLENTRRAYLEGMWEQLIAKVRTKFAGMKSPPLLTYGDNGFSGQTGFADKLDILAASEYPTIASQNTNIHSSHYLMGIDDGKTSVEDFKTGWMRSLKSAGEEATRLHKKILFTELGFSRRKNSTADPWLAEAGCQQMEKPDGTLEAPVRVLKRPISKFERVRAIEALRKLIGEGKLPWLAGVAMWGTYTDPLHLPNEFCVDCRLADSQPYNQSVRSLFGQVGNVTNRFSPEDPCAPPAPKPKPTADLVEPPSADAPPNVTIPFVKMPDLLTPDNPLGLPVLEQRPDEPAPE